VFAKCLPRYASDYHLPDASTAVQFCIDKHVNVELSALGGSLPFAAHAWWTREENLKAWTPFVPELSSKIGP
jgi:hypothetical protein